MKNSSTAYGSNATNGSCSGGTAGNETGPNWYDKPLVNGAVTRILQAVSRDSEFVKRTDSIWGFDPSLGGLSPAAVLNPWGGAGGLRNGLYAICYFFSRGAACDPSEPEYEAQTCVGISKRAVQVIEQANIDGVQTVRFADLPAKDHQAVEVVFNDGTQLIFDWHATLNPNQPLVLTPNQFYGR
jgi:hypothetical protein